MSFNKTINVNGFLLKINKDRKIELVGTKRKEIEIIKEFEEGYLGKTYLIDFYGKKAVLKFPKYYKDLRLLEFEAKNLLFSKEVFKKLHNKHVPKVYDTNIVKINDSNYLINSKYPIPYIIFEFIDGYKVNSPNEEQIKKLAELVVKIHKKTKDKREIRIYAKANKHSIKLKSRRSDLVSYLINLDKVHFEYKKNKKYGNLVIELAKILSASKIFRKNFSYTTLTHGDLSFENILFDKKENKIILLDASYPYHKVTPFIDLAKIYRYFLIRGKSKFYEKFLNYYLKFLNEENKKELFDFLIKLTHLEISIGTLWYFRVNLQQDNEFLRKVEEICDKDYELLKENKNLFLNF